MLARLRRFRFSVLGDEKGMLRMKIKMSVRRAPLIVFLAGAALMPGCVVEEINDQIVLSNDNLTGIELQLAQINESLIKINGQLGSVEQEVGKTNENLESLRRTINNIDQTIPFLKFSGDDEEDQEALEEEHEAEKQEQQPKEQAGS